jgi:hypothetical protein
MGRCQRFGETYCFLHLKMETVSTRRHENLTSHQSLVSETDPFQGPSQPTQDITDVCEFVDDRKAFEATFPVLMQRGDSNY